MTGQPTVRVRIGSQAVPLWVVSTSSADDRFDRSVFAGEADGRWLWLVLRPASAMLLLRDDWILRDVSSVGPATGGDAVRGAAPRLVRGCAGGRIDLHTHSRASDGTQSPTEVMRAAAEAGLDVVALTDHDTAQGWAEATAAADASASSW